MNKIEKKLPTQQVIRVRLEKKNSGKICVCKAHSYSLPYTCMFLTILLQITVNVSNQTNAR